MGQYAQPGYYPPPYYHQGQVPPFPPSVETTNAAPATVAQVSVGKDANETSTISTYQDINKYQDIKSKVTNNHQEIEGYIGQRIRSQLNSQK